MMPNQSTILRRLCCLHARMLLVVLPLLLVGCGVHEFPDVPDTAKVSLHLRFDTDMPQVYYTLSRTGAPVQVTSIRTRGTMRYIIRLYPQASAPQAIPVREYIVRRDVSQGYDADIDLDAPAGSYRVMVWADLSEDDAGVGGFYDASDFSSIRALTPYHGSTDYRDAFRGEAGAVVATSTSEQAPVGVTVQMTRPLAKFEFVANDVRLFIEQQSAAIAGHTPVDPSTGAATPAVDLDMFTVRIIYNGYAPNTYNIFTDKPTDAIMGVVSTAAWSACLPTKPRWGLTMCSSTATPPRSPCSWASTTARAVRFRSPAPSTCRSSAAAIPSSEASSSPRLPRVA